MHFDPDPLDSDDLAALKRFTAFLSRLMKSRALNENSRYARGLLEYERQYDSEARNT